MVTVNDRIDKARLRRDPEYLALAVCDQFKQVDTYHRGLITAEAFQRALQDLGLRCGQKEVEHVLQYCVITDDGYVHYKDLMQYLAPDQPRAKQSTAKGTIFPEERPKSRAGRGDDARESTKASSKASSSNNRSTFLAERLEDLQHAYARWDRGQLTNEAFKVELRGMGLTIPKELERLLVMNDMSRNMTFGQLMSAMQIDEIDGRRARAHYPQSESDTTAGYSAASEDPRYARPRSELSSWSSVTNGAGDVNSSLRQAICNFVDGNIPAPVFRRELQQCGVNVTPELNRLVTRHENANCVKFQEFARHILRQDRQELINSESATPSYPASPGENSVQSPSYRMPPQNLPYAVGGDWAPGGGRSARGPPSDAGSYVSRGAPSRASEGGGRFNAGGYPQQQICPPYATAEASPVLSNGAPSPDSMLDVPIFRPPSVSGNSRASRGSGGRERDDTEARDRRAQRQYSAPVAGASSASQRARTPGKSRHEAQNGSGNMADCLSWPAMRPPEEQGRPGKRFYGAGCPADNILPIGQDSSSDYYQGYGDVGFRRDLEARSAPFGTEADLAHRRPEDAGTYEYQPAVDRRGGDRGRHR